MKRYWALSKGNLLETLSYKGHFFFTLLGNIVYIILVYFLWKAIYGSAPSLNGMTFGDTFLYLTLATSIFSFMDSGVIWDLSGLMMSGDLSQQFLKPLNFQMYKLFEHFGMVINNFVALFIPSFILVECIFGGVVRIGANIPIFLISLLLAYIINYNLDFICGLISFYTESVWGVGAAMSAVTLFLSGAVIPLPFFPESIQKILGFLPFQAIFNTPLQILINHSLHAGDYLAFVIIQLIWAIALWALGALFFRQASKIVTVNGG